MEVVGGRLLLYARQKPRVAVWRWRGWAWRNDSTLDRTLYVRMCRVVLVDCVCMGGGLICMGRGRKGEEKLERIKTLLMQKEILKSRPALQCEGHANSSTRRPAR